eukprot:gene10809-10965_t
MQAWQDSVFQVLHQMRSLPLGAAAAGGGAAGLVQCCAALQSLLDEAEDLGHLQLCLAMSCVQPAAGRTPSGRAAGGAGPVDATIVRELLLAELVRLVDCPKADVLIKDSRMLPLAKMLYRLSKDSSNDARFRHHGAIRPLLAVVVDHSAWLEGMNSQKEQGQEQQTGEQLGALLKQQQEVLLLLSGCLKNISLDNTNQGSLARLHAVAAMGQVLAAQVQLITLAGAGCSSITSSEGASRGVLRAAEVQYEHQQQPEQQAKQQRKQAEAAVQISIQWLLQEPHQLAADARNRSFLELLVKVVRLIANAAVDQQVAGPMLCASPHMLTSFVQLLQTFSFEEHEELMLNSVAAVSNLAFYNISCNQLRQLREPGLLLKPLLALLTSGIEEAVTEAARAVANLGRMRYHSPRTSRSEVGRTDKWSIDPSGG